ncbi:MAG: hypothetical protein ACI3X1_06440 [Eubacteriales bacterium]
MGKGNRNSRQRLENQLAQEEKLLAKEKAKKSKKTSDRVIAAACIVIAVLIVAILVLNILGETGVFLRAQDAMYVDAENGLKVNAAMMTYFINDNITSWYNQYYIYVVYGLLSVDLNSDLRDQKMTSQDASYMGDSSLTGKSWYDFFIESTMENVEMYLTYASAYDKNKDAVEQFILANKSDDEEEQSIDDIIKELKASLRENDMTIADQYGKGVTEQDIRACYELVEKAQKFAEYNMDVLEKELEANDDPVKKYPDEHKSEFISADYLSYTITVSEKNEGTQLKYDEAVKNAKLAVEKFKEAKTPADFANLIELYKKSPSKFVGTTETDDVTDTEETTETATEKATETDTEKETTEEELIEKYTGTIYYDTEEDFGKWVFEETAETYDIYVDEEEGTELATTATKSEADEEESTETQKPSLVETETTEDGKIVYEKYTVTVYMLLTKPSMDYELTHNFAYLISDQKDAVEKFLAEYIKSEKKDGEAFVDLAKNFTPEHDHTEEDHDEPVYNYSQVERAKEKYFNESYQLINDWIDAEERKAGDYTDKIIEVTVKSSDGKTETKYYAAVLFEDHDKEAWYADAFNGALQDSINDWYEEAKKTYPVKPNNDVIDGLTTIGG